MLSDLFQEFGRLWEAQWCRYVCELGRADGAFNLRVTRRVLDWTVVHRWKGAGVTGVPLHAASAYAPSIAAHLLTATTIV